MFPKMFPKTKFPRTTLSNGITKMPMVREKKKKKKRQIFLSIRICDFSYMFFPQIALDLETCHPVPRSRKTPFDAKVYTFLSKLIALGYRHFHASPSMDAELGSAIMLSDIQRRKFFITITVDSTDDNIMATVEKRLHHLHLTYVDLLLLRAHGTDDNYLGDITRWAQVESCRMSCHAYFLGVSNYSPSKVDLIFSVARIEPVVAQIEYHPHHCNDADVKYFQEKGITVLGYLGLAPVKFSRALIDKLNEIAEKHRVNENTITIKWMLKNVAALVSADDIYVAFEYLHSRTKLSASEVQQISEAGLLTPTSILPFGSNSAYYLDHRSTSSIEREIASSIKCKADKNGTKSVTQDSGSVHSDASSSSDPFVPPNRDRKDRNGKLKNGIWRFASPINEDKRGISHMAKSDDAEAVSRGHSPSKRTARTSPGDSETSKSSSKTVPNVSNSPGKRNRHHHLSTSPYLNLPSSKDGRCTMCSTPITRCESEQLLRSSVSKPESSSSASSETESSEDTESHSSSESSETSGTSELFEFSESSKSSTK